MGVEMEHERKRDALRKQHIIDMEKSALDHQQEMKSSEQKHIQIVEKHKETIETMKLE